jgi:hypothetical protein
MGCIKMALQTTINSEIGISFENAYCYISMVGGSKDLLSIQVNWYVNEAARIADLRPIESKGYSFIPNVAEGSTNFIKQGYLYLKTLEEFANAIDC